MDQKQLSVSVILPIYNAGDLLRPQVDSVLAQTHPPSELLLIDDGSTDGSSDVAQNYAKRYSFVGFQRNEVNKGLLTTVNEAIEQVSGDLIAFSDHDDVWLPEKISRQVNYLVSHPDVVCVFSDRTIIDLEDNELCGSEYTRIGMPPEISDTTFLLASMARYTHANTLMFRRKLVEAIFPIPCGWDWWIAAVSSWFGRIAFMRDLLVRYRVYEGSLSSNQQLYLSGSKSHTSRAQVRENVRRHYEVVTSLYERGRQLAIPSHLLAPVESWSRWYTVLFDLLTQPNWSAYQRGLTLLPVVGKHQWYKLTLYALPPIHEAYLRVAFRFRGH